MPSNFHPEIPQDPNVPDGIGELQIGSNVYFGPDLAPINGKPPGYVLNGLIDNVDWLTRALDVQGYRLDHVQGISTTFLLELLAAAPCEEIRGWRILERQRLQVNAWAATAHWMQGRSSVLDFPLYFTLLAMSNDPSFDMATLDHAGVAGVNPLGAVTFVENHDTESRRDRFQRIFRPKTSHWHTPISDFEGFSPVFLIKTTAPTLSVWEATSAHPQEPHVDSPEHRGWAHAAALEGCERIIFERMGGAHLLVR